MTSWLRIYYVFQSIVYVLKEQNEFEEKKIILILFEKSTERISFQN